MKSELFLENKKQIGVAKVKDPKDKSNNTEGLNSKFHYEPLLFKVNDK